MSRQRLTWTRQADASKTASPPPAMPGVGTTEGPDSPAYLPDPPQDKYENGDTSTWAEDPNPPPYPEGPPPAMPGNGTTEEVTHPAAPGPDVVSPPTGPTTEAEADARAPKAASAQDEVQLKAAAEAKAALCVRIIQATTTESTVGDIEIRAMAMMDLPDEQIAATAATLNITAEDDDDQDEASDDDDDAKMSNKKATQEITARLERMEQQTAKLVKAFGDFFGMDDLMMEDDDGEVELDMMLEDGDMSDDELMATLTNMADDMDGDGIDQSDNEYPGNQTASPEYAMDEFDKGEESEGTETYDEGEMLASLMAELTEGHMAATSGAAPDAQLAVEPLATGPSIQSGEGGNVNPDAAPVTPEVEQMDGSEKTAEADIVLVDPSENDIALTAGVDPMGLMDDSTTASPNDELIALYADLDLPKTAKKGDDDEEDDDDDNDEEVEVEETEEEVEANKKAGKQVPQPKKASGGPKTLGAVPQTKQAKDEIAELSQIWDQAPDVREFFGIPK